jgi:YidC/Oxa1 family membrane protein insertase
LVVRKTYRFVPDRYDMDVTLEVGGRDPAAAAAWERTLGSPVEARIGWGQGIASTERNKRWEAPGFRSFEMVGEELVFRNARALSGGAEKATAEAKGTVRFAGVQNKYFTIAGLVPASQASPVEGRARISGDPTAAVQTWSIVLPLQPVPGGEASSLSLYVGPTEFALLKSYGVGLEKTVDLGWKLFHPIAEAVLRLMTWMYRWLPNYGVIIILLSIITKVGFYPLTRSSTRSMKRLQEVQPKLKAIQEKYKNNQQKLGEEMMKLYREEKINPLGGCLPTLVQMPVFIALYQVLRGDIALRQAPFALWIHDLGQPDALFRLPVALPFLGNEFNLLPLMMAATTYWQMKLTPTAPGANPSMAMMNKLMPVMMLFFFYGFPSGLVLYWLVNNLLTIYQTWRIHSTTPVTGGAQA